MKKTLYIIGAVIIIAAATMVIFRFGLGGSEDDWICDDGVWVKHGNPSAAMPQEPCQ